MNERLMALLDEYEEELIEALTGKLLDLRLDEPCTPLQETAFELYKVATEADRMAIIVPSVREAVSEARAALEERL